jgi:exonuclease SbcC
MATAVKRETTESEERLRVLHGRIAALAQQLEEARKAPLELAAVERELGALGYDPSTHEHVREALQGLTSAEEEHRLLQQATTGLPQERENLERVSALADRRQEAVAQAEQRLSAIQGEITGLAEMEQGLEASETRRRAQEQQHEGLVARHGFLDGWLKHSMEVESNRAEGEATLSRIAGQREVFDQLAVAFGRTGVQALLVEAAMPELEAEANRMLGRMTDNSMHLTLETQRASHRGEAVETLEIKVADVLGTRSYETFSGGEAFRINLALRIALSKLLAHRSGAPMPTLFIDEGFGTQDASGRERILDVIQSIAEDFECILVITHMEEVKDAFPVRIEVERTASGSTFALT